MSQRKKPSRPGPQKPAPRQKPVKKKSKKALFWWGLGLVLLVPAIFAIKWTSELPNYRELERLKLVSNSKVMDRNLRYLGTLPVTLPTGVKVDRSILQIKDMSPYLPMAVVTNEDRRFYQHYGLDFLGLGRSILKILSGDRLEGGSTITNQVIKNTLLAELSTGRTLERKYKEWLLSVQVERYFSKEEILTNYLNVIYWGSGGATDLMGADMAARGYFGKSASRLTLAESVYLATLVPSARRYFDYKGYRPLMKSLLDRMVEDGRVSQAEADAAWREPIRPAGWRVRYDREGNLLEAELVNSKAKNLKADQTSFASHFMQQLEKQLRELLPEQALYSEGGLKIITTLDHQAQQAIEQASRNARVPEGATLGAAIVDPYTGDVRAMVGQKLDLYRKEWNNAAQAKRQVGSSIKPLLYATALEKGHQQYDTQLDAPVNFDCPSCPNGKYSPQNFSRSYTGRETLLRVALDQSLNLPTVRLLDKIGLNTFKDKLRELRFDLNKNEGLSLSLGTLETSPLKMSLVYASFVNGGLLHEPNYVVRVENSQGQVLYDAENHRSKGKRVWSEQTAFVMWDMLRGVVYDQAGRLATAAQIRNRTVGGKTGTTNDQKDLWFVGVTPELAGAVWVGKEEGGAMPASAFSGTVAAPIWRDMMAGALNGKPFKNVKRPDGIVYETHAGYRMAVVRDTPPPGQETTPQPQPEPNPEPQEQARPEETPYIPEDEGTMLVVLDSATGYLADASTPQGNRVERRIRKEDLNQFVKPKPEPQPDPTVITEETQPEVQEDPAPEVILEDGPPPDEVPQDSVPSETPVDNSTEPSSDGFILQDTLQGAPAGTGTAQQ